MSTKRHSHFHNSDIQLKFYTVTHFATLIDIIIISLVIIITIKRNLLYVHANNVNNLP